MPKRSAVSQLPEEVRDELNRRLVEGEFGDYIGLSRWLQDLGFEISKSALHRHGAALEADFEMAMADVRRTRALAKAARAGSDEDAESHLIAATSGILQEQLLRVSIALRQVDDDPAAAAKSISLIARAHADVGRLQVALSKWQEELRGKTAQVAESVEKVARRGGLSADAVETIRREILGISA